MRQHLFIFIALLPMFAAAQRTAIPLNISLFNESTAIPFTRFVTFPIHPGLQVGTEWDYVAKPHSRLFQTAHLSYYYHAHLNQGIGAGTELGYEYRHRTGLAGAALLGMGYLHSFTVDEEYVFENGEYQKKADAGNARICPGLSLDVGYYLIRENPTSPKLFLRYQSWAEFPYSPGFIPVMTHINLHMGIRLMIAKGGARHED